MQKYNFYQERSFLIIYFISVYAMLLVFFIVSKIFSNLNIFVSYIIPQIMYIGVTIIYSKAKKIDIIRAMPIKFRMRPMKYFWTLLVTVGLFCVSLLPNMFIFLIFEKMGLNPTVNLPSLTSAKNIILAFLIICILPAVGEEMVFRGVCNSAFREYGGVLIILLSGLMFSLSHFNIAQTVYQFFLGVLLSYLYLKTNNLLVPIIIHCINNMIALFLPLIIPFFATITLSGSAFAVLVPMFFSGIFITVLAIKMLINDTIKSKAVTVFEYNPSDNEFVAVSTEKLNRNKENSIFKKLGYPIKQTFLAIINVFNMHSLKQKIKRFMELFPKTKNINGIIKILIIAIIGLWLISVLL